MKILAVANQKGGVGKTTTAWSLADALATIRKKRVLIIDLDPQASASVAAGVDAEGASMAEVMGGANAGTKSLGDIIQKLDDNLYLAPSDIALSASERGLIQRMSWPTVLKRSLEGLNVDYVLIDCPPSLGVLTINALVAADAVLIPTSPEYLALRGLSLMFDTVRQVREELNPKLYIQGVLVTFYDTRLLHGQEVIDAMQGQGLPVLPMYIRRSVRLAESAVAHETILRYDPTNPSAQAYRELAERIDA